MRACVLFLFFCSTILERKGRLLVSLLVFEVAGKMTKVAMQGKNVLLLAGAKKIKYCSIQGKSWP